MEIKSQQDQQTSNMSDAERWASLIGGGALVLLGLQQRSLRGALMALTGGGMGTTVQRAKAAYRRVLA